MARIHIFQVSTQIVTWNCERWVAIPMSLKPRDNNKRSAVSSPWNLNHFFFFQQIDQNFQLVTVIHSRISSLDAWNSLSTSYSSLRSLDPKMKSFVWELWTKSMSGKIPERNKRSTRVSCRSIFFLLLLIRYSYHITLYVHTHRHACNEGKGYINSATPVATPPACSQNLKVWWNHDEQKQSSYVM